MNPDPRTKPDDRSEQPVCIEAIDADMVANRIGALTEFVSRVGPVVGERRDGTCRADDDVSPSVVIARDDALIQAYEAIGRLSAGC